VSPASSPPSRRHLQRELRRLLGQLAEQIMALLDSAGAFDRPSVPPASPAADAARTVEPPRTRRSELELEALGTRITAALRAERVPTAISTLAARLGLEVKDIAHPISLLVAAGKIRQAGTRRGTRYTLPTSAPRKHARRRGAKGAQRRRTR
jgi:hypothetical protein